MASLPRAVAPTPRIGFRCQAALVAFLLLTAAASATRADSPLSPLHKVVTAEDGTPYECEFHFDPCDLLQGIRVREHLYARTASGVLLRHRWADLTPDRSWTFDAPVTALTADPVGNVYVGLQNGEIWALLGDGDREERRARLRWFSHWHRRERIVWLGDDGTWEGEVPRWAVTVDVRRDAPELDNRAVPLNGWFGFAAYQYGRDAGHYWGDDCSSPFELEPPDLRVDMDSRGRLWVFHSRTKTFVYRGVYWIQDPQSESTFGPAALSDPGLGVADLGEKTVIHGMLGLLRDLVPGGHRPIESNRGDLSPPPFDLVEILARENEALIVAENGLFSSDLDLKKLSFLGGMDRPASWTPPRKEQRSPLIRSVIAEGPSSEGLRLATRDAGWVSWTADGVDGATPPERYDLCGHELLSVGGQLVVRSDLGDHPLKAERRYYALGPRGWREFHPVQDAVATLWIGAAGARHAYACVRREADGPAIVLELEPRTGKVLHRVAGSLWWRYGSEPMVAADGRLWRYQEPVDDELSWYDGEDWVGAPLYDFIPRGHRSGDEIRHRLRILGSTSAGDLFLQVETGRLLVLRATATGVTGRALNPTWGEGYEGGGENLIVSPVEKDPDEWTGHHWVHDALAEEESFLLATSRGLFRMDRETLRLKQIPMLQESGEKMESITREYAFGVWRLCRSDAGDLWCAMNGRLWRREQGTEFFRPARSIWQEDSEVAITDMIGDPDDPSAIWVSYGERGLVKVRPVD